jgi:predicted transcriptional regulator
VETQNITLSLPRALLRKAKVVAAKRDTSVSALLAASLSQLVQEDDAYEAAMKRLLARARVGYPLNLDAHKPFSREDLHAR